MALTGARLSVRTGKARELFPPYEIDCIQFDAEGSYIDFTTSEGQPYIYRVPTKEEAKNDLLGGKSAVDELILEYNFDRYIAALHEYVKTKC